MTNGTIFTSASSTSHISVAIHHYQQPMGLYVSQFVQYARACSANDQIWIKISCRGFSRCVWRQHFANSVVDIKIESILFIQSSLVKCCTKRFKTILLSRFYTLIALLTSRFRLLPHGESDLWTGEVYSS